MQYTLASPAFLKIPSKCRDTETGLSVAGWASQVAVIMLATQMISHQVQYVTRQLIPKMRFTRGHVRELKNAHNSVTVQNRTHVYINFFDHKDLGNHLLQ